MTAMTKHRDRLALAALVVLTFGAGSAVGAPEIVDHGAAALPVNTPAALLTERVVNIRSGDHPGFGRIVFDVANDDAVQVVVEGSRALLVFPPGLRLLPPPSLPRNALRLSIDGATATLSFSPASRVRQRRLGDRLILDVLDPPTVKADRPVTVQVKPSPRQGDPPAGASLNAAPANLSVQQAKVAVPVASPLNAPSNIAVSETIAVVPASRVTSVAASPQVQGNQKLDVGKPMAVTPPPPMPNIEPVTPSPGPVSGDLGASPATTGFSFVVLSDATVGAALFRRAGLGVLVLDHRLPALSPPAIAGASVSLGGDNTVVQFPVAPELSVTVERTAAGWAISSIVEPIRGGLTPVPLPDGAAFPLNHPGRVVSIVDPLSAGTLLVGTSLVAGLNTGVTDARRSPSYAVLPTWLGVVIEPASEYTDLRAGRAGFILRGGEAVIGQVSSGLPAGRLDLPNRPAPELFNRLRAQLASAASAPPRSRTTARVAAAQALIAMGMGVEAQALLLQAMADDPQATSDSQLLKMSAIAAIMAGRLDEAGALDRADLAGDTEADLWRGVRDRRMDQETDAARRVASGVVLALAYPEPLQRLIWPDVAEAAAESGVPVPAGKLTAFASALALDHAGLLENATTAWEALTRSPNRYDQVRATTRLAELDLAAGRSTPRQTAERMDRLAVAWRGDSREFNLRLRSADLKAAAGNWKSALDGLRETEVLFPEGKAVVKDRKAAVFDRMLATAGAGLEPVDIVLLAADYADCVPDAGTDTRFAQLLAEKLMTLDLPARAIPVLQGLIKGSKPGAARAEIGVKLSQLLLEAGDAEGGRAALEMSDSIDLPPDVMQRRTLLHARISAALGRLSDAVETLKSLPSIDADELRATLATNSGDLAEVSRALEDLSAKVVPSSGDLPEAAQRVIIRQASVAAQRSDAAGLKRLERYVDRMTPPRVDILRLLIATPITFARDLPRSAIELKTAKVIPQQLQISAAK